MRVTAADGSQWRVGRRLLRPTLTLARWGQLVRKTGAGDLTAEISFERGRNNAAGAELGIVLMIVMVVRFLVALLLAPIDAALSLAGARPWYVQAKKLDRARRRHLWAVDGWRASETLICEIAASLETGHRLPDGDVLASA